MDLEPESETGERLRLWFSALADIGEVIASAGDLEVLSGSLLRLILGSVTASKGAVLLYYPSRSELRVVARSRGVQLSPLRWPLAPELAAELLQAREPVALAQPPPLLAGYRSEHPALFEALGAHLWIPLATRGTLLGVLSLSRKFLGREEYSKSDLELLWLMGQNATLALHNYDLVRDLKETNFRLNRKIVELENLHEMGLSITSLAGLDELPDTVLLRAVSLCDAGGGTLLLRGAGEQLIVAAHFGLDPASIARAAAGPLARVVEAETPLLLNQPSEALRSLPCNKLVAVPLLVGGKNLGALIVCDKESRGGYEDFGEDDVRLLSSLTAQAGVAFENARLYRGALERERLEKELEIASTIQKALLPKEYPKIPGLDLAALTIPTRHVGGDYFDFFALPYGQLGLAIADVSGKGIPAALLVSTLHAALHAEVEQRAEKLLEGGTCADPLELCGLVSKLNRRVFGASTRNKYITFLMAVCNRKAGLLHAVNAGHNYPVVVRADGRVERPREGGFFLGMFESAHYPRVDLPLASGDLLCLFTDGISEARSARGDEFGEERLVEMLVERRAAPARETVDAIVAELGDFTAGQPQYDDMTLVLLRAEEPV